MTARLPLPPERYLLRSRTTDDMDIALRERNADALFIEAVLDGFGGITFDTPVVPGFSPDTHDKVDAAVSEFRDSHLHEVADNYDHFIDVIQGGEWALSWYCGSAACEQRVKEDSSAVSRNFPLDQPYPGESGKCIICGEHADEMAYFAKAY